MEITLRPYKLSDADDFMEWGCDDEVIRSSRLRHYSSKEDALNYLKEEAIPHPWCRAICLNSLPVGFICFVPGSSIEKCRGMISYALGFKHWGQGITTLALKRAGFFNCVQFVESPDVQRIEGVVEVNNKASQRVLEKAGFLREGVLRKYLFVKERSIIDVVMYSLLSTDPVSYHNGISHHWNQIG